MTIATIISSPIKQRQTRYRHVQDRFNQRYGLAFGKDQIKGIERVLRTKREGNRLFCTIRRTPIYRQRQRVGHCSDLRWVCRVAINGQTTYPVVSERSNKIVTVLPSEAIAEWRSLGVRQLDCTPNSEPR
jgi:hypothetical protein